MGKLALERAEKIAGEVIKRLEPYCKKIKVAGSVRRRRPWVNDIDFVLIPADPWNLQGEILGLGTVKVNGTKVKRVIMDGTQIDIYVASEETWATLLLIRTGPEEQNIRLCRIAKEVGWHLRASGEGLFNAKDERIAGDTEISIYEALGLVYQEPWERG